MTTKQVTKTNKASAVELIIKGESVTKTAELVGVTRETVSRWVNHDPEFKALMAEAHQGAVAAMHHRLAGLTDTAVTTLADICKDPDHRPADRINAAKIILDKVAPSDITPPEETIDLHDILGDQYETVMQTIEQARTDT